MVDDPYMKRNKWLIVRMTEAERAEVETLAASYEMKASEFVRAFIRYVRINRPPLMIVPLKEDVENRA